MKTLKDRMVFEGFLFDFRSEKIARYFLIAAHAASILHGIATNFPRSEPSRKLVFANVFLINFAFGAIAALLFARNESYHKR
jgi:hypothetical protein